MTPQNRDGLWVQRIVRICIWATGTKIVIIRR